MTCRRRDFATWILFTGLVLSVAAPPRALGGDLAPPPWDPSSPLTTFAEWKFLTGTNPLAPDSDRPPVIGDSGGVPMAHMLHMDYKPGAVPAWVADMGVPGIVCIFDPNFVDDQSYKLVYVEMWYSSPVAGGAPFVDSMIGFKPSDPSLDPIFGIPLNSASYGNYGRTEEWEFPYYNPDFEFIRLVVPPGTALNQLAIWTISIPEPAGLHSAAVGILGLLCYRRRLQKRSENRVTAR